MKSSRTPRRFAKEPSERTRKAGLKLFTDGKVRRIGQNKYVVQSQQGQEEYTVENYNCPCDSSWYNPSIRCAHVCAVEEYESANPGEWEVTPTEPGTSSELPSPREQPPTQRAGVPGDKH